MNKQFIGKKLKQLRREQGLTLSEVTKGIMSPATLSFIENGKQKVNQKHLGQLLKKLHVPEKKISVFLLNKTGNETKKVLNQLMQLVYHMKFGNMDPLIKRLDYESMSRDDRVLFLFFKSLYALNQFNKDLLNHVNEEMSLYYTNDPNESIYYIYWRFKANFLSFYGDQEESITINKKLLQLNYCPINPLIFSSTFNGLCRSHLLFEDFHQAMEYVEIDYQIKTMCNLKLYACDSLLGLAGIFMKIGDTKNQKKSLNDALEQALNLNNPNILGKALYNFGEYYYLQDEATKAVRYWKDSLIYKRQSSERTSIFTSLRALSEHYFKESEYELAKPYIQEGMEKARELNHSRFHYIFKLLNVKYLYETDPADQFIEEAKECEKYYLTSQLERIDSSLQDSDNLKQLYQMLGKYYYKNKKYKKAGEYFSKIDLLDKIPL